VGMRGRCLRDADHGGLSAGGVLGKGREGRGGGLLPRKFLHAERCTNGWGVVAPGPCSCGGPFMTRWLSWEGAGLRLGVIGFDYCY
jgi:hypothetical protein